MTGWVCYQNGVGPPAAHADILLSSRVGNDASFDLPIFFAADESGKSLPPIWDPKYVPVGVCQKICIVSPRLAYIWAGSLSLARQVDKRLRAANENDSLDIGFIERLGDDLKGADLSLMILYNIRGHDLVLAGINATQMQIVEFGATYFGGAGEGEFFSVVGQLMANLHPKLALEDYDKGLIDKDRSDAEVRPRLMDSKLQIRMMMHEFNHVMTGGGVDTLRVSLNGFSKMSDYLYAIFDERMNNGLGFSPRVLVKRCFIDGYLGFSVADLLKKTYGTCIVPSPYNWAQPYEMSSVRLDPFSGDLWGVSCIYLRADETISHYMESSSIWKENTARDNETGRLLISEWYQRDAAARLSQADKQSSLDS